MPSMSDQPLGVGDGVRSAFQLCIYYGSGSEAQQRLITRPVAGSIMLGVDGMAGSGWGHLGKGVIAFGEGPAGGAGLTAGFRFGVPVGSEGGRGGKEGVRMCGSRWSEYD